MATLPESLDYSSKDFDALRARLMSLVKSVFPDWTDFDVASFGNLLLERYVSFAKTHPAPQGPDKRVGGGADRSSDEERGRKL